MRDHHRHRETERSDKKGCNCDAARLRKLSLFPSKWKSHKKWRINRHIIQPCSLRHCLKGKEEEETMFNQCLSHQNSKKNYSLVNSDQRILYKKVSWLASQLFCWSIERERDEGRRAIKLNRSETWKETMQASGAAPEYNDQQKRAWNGKRPRGTPPVQAPTWREYHDMQSQVWLQNHALWCSCVLSCTMGV